MNDVEKVKKFVKMGANPNSWTVDGTSSLQLVMEIKHKKIAEIFFNNGAKFDIPNGKSGAAPTQVATKLNGWNFITLEIYEIWSEIKVIVGNHILMIKLS